MQAEFLEMIVRHQQESIEHIKQALVLIDSNFKTPLLDLDSESISPQDRRYSEIL